MSREFAAVAAPNAGRAASMLRRRSQGLLAALLVALSVAQAARLVQLLWEERSLSRGVQTLTATIVDELQAPPLSEEDGGTLGDRLPTEAYPGELLAELVGSLEASGFANYRYRLLAAPEISANDAEGAGLAVIPALSAAPANPTDAQSLNLPVELAWPPDAANTPAALRAWGVGVAVRGSSYALDAFLEELSRSSRVWQVSQLSIDRGERDLTATLVLATWTRRSDSPNGPASGTDPLEDEAAAEFEGGRDLFAAPSLRAPDPDLPRLSAILGRAGSREAFLHGRSVRVGESCGDWTLLRVEESEVLLQHRGGRTAIVRLTP